MEDEDEEATNTTSLRSLPITENIYLGTDSDGGLNFRAGLKWATQMLEARYLIALGLTEVCCELKIGKVYYFSMFEKLTRAHTENVDSKTRKSIVYNFFRLPKLVYVPYVWSKEDQRLWREMRHSDRFLLLNARSGAIRKRQEVMPLDLAYESEEKKSIRLNRFNEEHTGCKALLAIMPQAYLGWCPRMQENHLGVEHGSWSLDHPRGAWFLTNKEILRDSALPTAQAVVERLWDMFFEREPRSLMKLEDLICGLMEFESALPKS